MKLSAPATLLLAALLIPPLVPAQTALGPEQQITQLLHDWGQARIKGDTAFLERFYGKELVINGMTGTPVKRDDDIALFASRSILPEVITDEDLTIHTYGQTVVVTGVETNTGSYKGHSGTVYLRFLGVFLQRENRWQLVAFQSTQVRKPTS